MTGRRDSISEIHSDLRTARLVGRGVSQLPEKLRTVLYKTYPRMEQIPLSVPLDRSCTLADAFQMRSSQRSKNFQTLATKLQLGKLLLGLRSRPDGTRPYPSGGGHYPIETYFIGKLDDGSVDVYHYRPDTHLLERLWELPKQLALADLYALVKDNQPTCGLLIFTAVWERSASSYGDFAYQLSLLEAGHMAQNVLLAAADCRVNARPIAGYSDSMACEALDLDNSNEQPVYAIQFS